jgi:hypothetical protein
MWSYLLQANYAIIVILCYSLYYLQKHDKDKMFINIAGGLLIVSCISGFQVHSQYKLEQTHDIEMTFQYIDQMSPLELKNKLKTCMIDSGNCTFVFVQK